MRALSGERDAVGGARVGSRRAIAGESHRLGSRQVAKLLPGVVKAGPGGGLQPLSARQLLLRLLDVPEPLRRRPFFAPDLLVQLQNEAAKALPQARGP